jgi:hypothetical protein
VIDACIHPEWKMQSYEYVPGTVRVTLYVWPDVMICGEFAGLAPEGTLVHTTSCGAPLWLSWSAKVTTVPGATVTLAGEKLSVWSAPTFWGMTMVTAPPVGGADVAVAVVVVEVGVLVVVDVVVTAAEEEVVVDEVLTAAEEEVEDAVVDEEAVAEEDVDAAVVVAALVELAVIVGLPAPFVVHHMVVHVDDEAAAVVVTAAELDAVVVVVVVVGL